MVFVIFADDHHRLHLHMQKRHHFISVKSHHRLRDDVKVSDFSNVRSTNVSKLAVLFSRADSPRVCWLRWAADFFLQFSVNASLTCKHIHTTTTRSRHFFTPLFVDFLNHAMSFNVITIFIFQVSLQSRASAHGPITHKCGESSCAIVHKKRKHLAQKTCALLWWLCGTLLIVKLDNFFLYCAQVITQLTPTAHKTREMWCDQCQQRLKNWWHSWLSCRTECYAKVRWALIISFSHFIITPSS